MELAGLYGGPVREPLSDLGEADRERAEQYYQRISESRVQKA
jgi:4-hydroxy-tetrahydrodipicolinate synthase